MWGDGTAAVPAAGGGVDPASVTLESLRAAIGRLYAAGAEPLTMQQASRWLTEAKALPHSWPLLWPLLSADKTAEEQFLAATFLRDKIRDHWTDEQQRLERDPQQLRSRLLLATVDAHQRAGPAARPLTEALASLAVQTTPNQWQEPIPELCRLCQSLSDASLGARLLLATLTELPHELDRCMITTARRAAAKANFKRYTDQVLELVLGILRQWPAQPADLAGKCMELLAAWTQLELLASQLFPVLDLVLVPFVRNPALMGVALDMLERVVSSPHNYNYPATVLQLAERVLQLQPFIQQLVTDKDPEALVALGNVFTSLVASHSRTVVTALAGAGAGQTPTCERARQQDVARRLVAALLELASVPGRYPTDETVSELTFGVWYTLQDDVLACEDEQRTVLTQHLQPVYASLLDVMLQKAMLPGDHQPPLGPDDAEAFRRYRQDILDFYTYTQSLLGDYMLSSLIVYLHGAMGAVRQDQSRWPALEAILHALTGLGESCDDELSLADGMRTVLLTLPEIPYGGRRALVTAALRLIDASTACLQLHADCLGPLVPLLLAALHQPDTALYATMALKDICQEAPEAMAPHAAAVLAACKEVLVDGGRLSAGECVRLMYVVGALVGFVDGDPQRRVACLEQIVQPTVDQLNAMLDEKSPEPEAVRRPALVLRLNMLASLASALPATWAPPPPVHPLLLLLRQLTPTLQLLAHSAAHDELVTESICNWLQRSLACLGEAMEPAVQTTLQLLSTLYSREPHPQVLELVKQLVLTFAGGGLAAPLRQALSDLLAASVQYLDSEEAATARPETVAGLLDVLAQLLKKRPALVTQPPLSQHAAPLITLAGRCVRQADRRLVRAACIFLVQLVGRAAEAAHVADVLRAGGAPLVHSLLAAIGGAAPRDCVELTADVLLALNRWDVVQLQQWLAALMAQADFPSRRAADADKQTFVKHVLQSRNNKTFLRSKVAVFAQQCRGMHGTAYGAATLNTGHI